MKNKFEIAVDKAFKQERKKAYDEIGKAFKKMVKAGYGEDLNLFAIMHELQQKFK